LLIDQQEAATVRMIFERYLALRSIGQLVDELAQTGVRTKVRALKDGRTTGGVTFYQGPLAAMLKNPVYIGKVAHGGMMYEGEHEAIIDETLWNEVQASIASNRYRRKVGLTSRYPSLLTGMLTDPDGRAMTTCFTTKGSQRHHYYATRLKPGEDRKVAWRIPASEVDRRVIAGVRDWLSSGAGDPREDEAAGAVERRVEESRSDAGKLSSMSVAQQRELLLDYGVTVELGTDQLAVRIAQGEQVVSLELPARLAHRGPELKLVLDGGADPDRRADPVLLKLVVLANAARQAMAKGEHDPLVAHYSKRHLWQLLRISWLAPDITAAIVEGTQPVTLTGRRLLRATDIPLAWIDQRAFFGFA
jgi:site-specific DNA recombinase